MDTRKLIEKKTPSAEAKDTQDSRTLEAVKLVEMGAVSMETKGFYRGIEVGYTPRS